MVDHPVGGDAALTAEEVVKHQRRGGHQLPDAQGDHGEGGGALLGRHVAEHDRQPKAGDPGQQRDDLHRQRKFAAAGRVQKMHRGITAYAEERGMAQREQPGLAKQHVVRERQDHHHAHLAEHGDDEPGIPPGVEVVEQPWRHQGQRDRDNPYPAGDVTRADHVSRVPIRPRGRNNNISTIMAKGSSAPMRAMGTVSTSISRLSGRRETPNGCNKSATE